MPVGGRRAGSGRKAKPTEQKLREGARVRDRTPGVERPPDGKRPRPPAGLDARAKAAWKGLLDGLEADAMIDSSDAPLYEAFAVNLARARQARATIAKHGLVFRNDRGGLSRNPAIAVERDALREVRMLSEVLAIGPSARARLGMSIARGARAPVADDPEAATGELGPSPRLSVVK